MDAELPVDDVATEGQDIVAAEYQALAGAMDYESRVNLVPTYNDDQLKALGRYVCEMKRIGEESSSGYRQKQARHNAMFTGDMKGWTSDQQNILYVHMPYVMKGVLTFHAKMYRNMFPASGDIASFHSPLPKYEQVTRKRSRHFNHYLRKIVKEYLTARDRLGMRILLQGSGFSVWWYDPMQRRCRYQSIGSDDLIVPYKTESDMADMSDVPWIIWRKRMYRHELEALEDDTGGADGQPYYIGARALYPRPPGAAGEPTAGTGEAQQSGQVQQQADQQMGAMPSAEDQSQPRVILEMDCWLTPPGHARARPVTVCVDEATQRVMRVSPREREDPRDRRRYNLELEETAAQYETDLAVHAQALQRHEAAVSNWQAQQQPQIDIDEVTGEEITIPPVPPEQLGPVPQAPSEPEEPDAPRKPRRIPFHRFTHHGCIPNPEGFYNFGIAYLLEGPNIVADEVMSLATSLMRMNTLPTFLYPKLSGMMRGEFKLKLGGAQEIPVSVSEWNGGNIIKPLQFPPPDPNAFKLEQRMSEAAQEVTADDIVGGGQGLSGQTATETEVRTANAMDNISVIQARVLRAQQNELEVLAHMLSQVLDEEGEVFAVDDPLDQAGPQEYMVTRADYEDDFDILLTCDPNLASKPQKERHAVKVLQNLVALPPGTFDPKTTAELLRMGAIMVMDALDARPLSIAMQKAPPVPEPQPAGAAPAPIDETQGEGEGNAEPTEPVGPPTPDVAGAPLDALAARPPSCAVRADARQRLRGVLAGRCARAGCVLRRCDGGTGHRHRRDRSDLRGGGPCPPLRCGTCRCWRTRRPSSRRTRWPSSRRLTSCGSAWRPWACPSCGSSRPTMTSSSTGCRRASGDRRAVTSSCRRSPSTPRISTRTRRPTTRSSRTSGFCSRRGARRATGCAATGYSSGTTCASGTTRAGSRTRTCSTSSTTSRATLRRSCSCR